MTPTQSSNEQSVVFLNQAHEELEKGDLRQASEKGWGAAAQVIKAVAESRNWDHRSHRDLYAAVSRLREELGDDELSIQFNSAGMLHANFYEGWLDEAAIALSIAQVNLFIGKLQAQL